MRTAQVIRVVPTLDTGIYAAGDRLGSIQEITGASVENGKGSVLDSITVVDLNNQKIAMDIYFFSQLPTVASADNTAIDISNANLAYLIGRVNIATGDYVEIKASTNAVACIKNIKLALISTADNNHIYAVVVTRGGTPTYSAAGLEFKYGLENL